MMVILTEGRRKKEEKKKKEKKRSEIQTDMSWIREEQLAWPNIKVVPSNLSLTATKQAVPVFG